MDEKTQNKQGLSVPDDLFDRAWDSLVTSEKLFFLLLIQVIYFRGVGGTIVLNSEYYDEEIKGLLTRLQKMNLLQYKLGSKGLWIRILKWSKYQLVRLP